MVISVCRQCLEESSETLAVCPRCGSESIVAHAELSRLFVAHVDCDAFYASVEKRDDPSLRTKPVIVGHPGGRGVVTTACYIARQSGPRSAMPMFKALKLCPDAVVIRPNMAKYKAASEAIRTIFRSVTPRIEPLSLDEAYLDVSDGVRMDPRTPAVLLAEMAQRIERDVGVTVSVGLSANKFLAKLASDLDKPRGFAVIGREEAKSRLAGMPVRKVHGVGAATAKRMAEMGVTKVGQLQTWSEDELVRHFGKFGRQLAAYVKGEDPRDVTPIRVAKSVSGETTFAQDLREADDLIAAVRPLCDQVAARLMRSGVAGLTVVVKLKTGDFQTRTRNLRLTDATRRADVLFDAATTLIRREADGRPFRLVGVGVTDLCPAERADPPTLFDLA